MTIPSIVGAPRLNYFAHLKDTGTINFAARLGISVREVARALQVLTSGVDLSTFKRGVRQRKIIASLPADDRAAPADLSRLHLRGRTESDALDRAAANVHGRGPLSVGGDHQKALSGLAARHA